MLQRIFFFVPSYVLVFVILPYSYFATLSPISILDVRIAFLIPFDFLQTVQVYMIVCLFVDLDFIFCCFGGLLEYFPLFPVPEVRPLALSLDFPPRERGRVAERDFCFATLTI